MARRNKVRQVLPDAAIDLADCHGICLETANYALELGGGYADAARIKLLFDCADICQVTSNFMFPTSNPARRVAAICAQVCEISAEKCEEVKEDVQFQDCAKTCRRAAGAARLMAGLEPSPR